MVVYRTFKVHCLGCEAEFLPRYKGEAQRSPRRGVAAALLNAVDPCPRCGNQIKMRLDLDDRPIFSMVFDQLVVAGFLTETGEIVDPSPANVDPMEIVAAPYGRETSRMALPAGQVPETEDGCDYCGLIGCMGECRNEEDDDWDDEEDEDDTYPFDPDSDYGEYDAYD